MKKHLFFAGAIVLSLAAKSQNGIHITPSGQTGFNTTVPGNRVEITTGTGDPYHGSSNGSSGLRLTNLDNTKVALTNSTTKVLSVDNNGDIILVTDQTAMPGSGLMTANNGLSVSGGNNVQFGGPLGSAAAAALLNNREVPMGANKLLFSGLGTNYGAQITLGATPPQIGKFNVVAQELTGGSESYAGIFENRFTSGNSTAARFITQGNNNFTNHGITGNVSNGFINYGINMYIGNAQPGGSGIGAKFDVIDANNTAAGVTGVSAEVRGATGDNYALAGAANSPVGRNFGAAVFAGGGSNSVSNFGIQATTDAMGSSNIAGYFQSPNPNNIPGTPAAANYAIRATAPNFGGWTNSFAGYFDGDVTINGTGVITAGSWSPSDQRLKKDVKELKSAMDLISRISPKTYFYDNSQYKLLSFDTDRLQYGVIAQELEQIMPELVKEISVSTSSDPNKPEFARLKSVNYVGLVPVLVAGLKEQQQQIDELKALVNTLANSPDGSKRSGMVTPVSVNLSDKNSVILNQNVPNPFAESTVISYNIPTDFTKAQIIFSTETGNVIRVIDITTKGSGSLNVFADDLSHGIYSYTLVVDGKTIDSKKMLKN